MKLQGEEIDVERVDYKANIPHDLHAKMKEVKREYGYSMLWQIIKGVEQLHKNIGYGKEDNK